LDAAVEGVGVLPGERGAAADNRDCEWASHAAGWAKGKTRPSTRDATLDPGCVSVVFDKFDVET
jgi:hypothetical protein